MTANAFPKILIIEDDVVLKKILEDKLTQKKFSVLTAQNGEEGLKMALKNKPDLILLDILMPKMNGVDMLKKLRQDKWGKIVSVLLLTNDSDPEHMREVLRANADDYLIKSDWGLDDIVEKIKKTLKLG